MATTKKVIGRVPVVRYPYTTGMVLYKGNLVTVDGVTYEVIADQTTATPSESNADFRVFAGIPTEMLAQKVDMSMVSDELTDEHDKIPTCAAVDDAVSDRLLTSNIDAMEVSDRMECVPSSKAVHKLLKDKLGCEQIEPMSESEYEGLSEYDEETLYIVYEDEEEA